MSALEKNGFIVIKNPFTPDEIASVLSYIGKDTVRYGEMNEFVKSSALQKINTHMGTGWAAVATKYRVSDNNNSDASTFHRDTISLGAHNPAMTCVLYLDKTIMEVIPGSHKIQGASYSEALSIYGNRVQVELNPGDMLFFYASMLHRGILSHFTGHRRIIQIFDIFKTPEEYSQRAPELIHIPGDESLNNNGMMTSLTKTPGIINIMNWGGYLNAITGYGGERSLTALKGCELGGRDVFCSEGFCSRVEVQPGTAQKINTYIFLTDKHFDMPESCRATWKWALYNRQLLTYFIVGILALVILGIGAYSLVTKMRLGATRGRRTIPFVKALRRSR